MDKEQTVTYVGRSIILELLLVLFIGLKLTGYINWSWWWVMAPLWMPLAIGLALGLVVLVVILIGEFIEAVWK